MEFILKYWIQVFFGFLISLATYLYRSLKKEKEQIKTIRKTVVTLAKIEIINLYEEVKDKEAISIRQKEKLIELYQEYAKFEQCDIVSNIMEEINKKKIG